MFSWGGVYSPHIYLFIKTTMSTTTLGRKLTSDEEAELKREKAQEEANAQAAKELADAAEKEAKEAEKASKPAEKERQRQERDTTLRQDKPANKAASIDPEVALEKVRKALAVAQAKGDGDPEFRVTDEELQAILSLDGKDGKRFVKDRKKLWQRYIFNYGEKISTMIPRSFGENPVIKDGNTYYPRHYTRLNGVEYVTPKGIQVTIPKVVHDHYLNNYDPHLHQVNPIDMGGGVSSTPVSLTQNKPGMVW